MRPARIWCSVAAVSERIRATVWLPAAVFLILGAALLIWLDSTSTTALRNQLRVIQFWQLDALVALVAVTSTIGVRQLLRALALPWRALVAPLASALLAAVLVFGVAPATNRIYYDEQIYQSIGQSMADLHLAQLCNEGIVEYGSLQCLRPEYNKQPYGYPHLLSLAYRATGVSARTAHVVNALAAILLVWIVYLTVITLYADQRAGAFAALITATIPVALQWSHTAASEPTSALVAAGAMLALSAWIRVGTPATLLWAVVVASYSVQFRAEMVLMLGIVGLGLALSRRIAANRSQVAWALVLLFVLCAVAGVHLFAIRQEAWGTTGERLSLAYAWMNFRVNGPFYVWDGRFPAVVTALAIVGAYATRSRATVIVATWFVMFFGIYLVFYAGSYNYGADVRYSILTYPPLAVLAGAGAAAASRRLDAVAPGSYVVAAGLLFQLLWYLPSVRAVGEEAWAARADVAFGERVARQIPRNAIVFTHNPGMFQVWGVNSAQLSIAATAPDYVDTAIRERFAGGVFLHWNFWCNVSDPVQTRFCHDIRTRFALEPIMQYRERDYVFALYRLADRRPDTSAIIPAPRLDGGD